MKSNPPAIVQRPAKKRVSSLSATPEHRSVGRPRTYDWDSVDWKASPFDPRAIANRLGCPVESVNTRWRRIFKKKRVHSVLASWKDWTLSSTEIARKAGVSRQRVDAYRKQNFPPIGDA